MNIYSPGSLSSFYVVGGTVRRDASCYIQRQADCDLFNSLMMGKYCYVLTPRQMGKSSLMIHTAARLREKGAEVVVLDLTGAGQNLTVEQWYGGLLLQMGQQLNLDDELLEFWQSHSILSPLQRFTTAIRKVVLPRYRGRLVIFVDELDAVRSLSFSTDEFFAGIREFYNHRTQDEELERLAFCLLGVATPSDLIRDTRTTPFNIGRRIELHDFTEDEAMLLAVGLNRDENTNIRLLRRIIYWTDGHPYLTQRLCKTIAAKEDVNDEADVDRVCKELFLSARARERDSNLLFVREQILRSDADVTALLELYSRVHSQTQSRPVYDDETNPLFSVLQLSGITNVEHGALVVRNRIYRSAFDEAWVKMNMPDAERRRQRAAFKRGVIGASVIAIFISSIIVGIALYAFHQSNRAKTQEAANRKLLYAAKMNLAGQAWDNANMAQLHELIESQTPHPGQEDLRGFEWHFYKRMLNVDRATLQHTGQVLSIAFSPDGKLLATSSQDNSISIWDMSTRHPISKLSGHTRAVYKVAFSPDGHRLASAGWDSVVRIWDVTTNQGLMTLDGHTDRVCGLAFSPDGLKLATGSWDKQIKLWDTRSGKELIKLVGHANWVWSLEFSPDGKKLVSASEDRTVRLWDLETGKEEKLFAGHGASVYYAAFSPDGLSLASAGYSGEVKIWEPKTGLEISSLKGHTFSVNSVAFSQDGKTLATGGVDRFIRIWDVASGKELYQLKGHSDEIRLLAFSPDGRTLASACDDFTVKIWDIPNDLSSEALRHTEDHVDSSCISSDGKILATANETEIFFWDVTTKRMLSKIATGAMIYDICFSPNGAQLAVAQRDSTITIWNTLSRQKTGIMTGHRDLVVTISFSPDGKRIASGSRDHQIKIWDFAGKMEVATLTGHQRRVNSVAFSTDGKFLAAGSDDYKVKIWDAITLREIATLGNHTNEVWTVAFSPGGKILATGSYDRTVRIWDWKKGLVIHTLKGHSAGVKALVFSPDGKRLATGSEDRTIKLWDVENGLELTTLNGHTAKVMSLAFSPDGLTLASTGRDYTARLWRAEKTQLK